MWISENKLFGKKISVITESPLSANNSTDALSIINVKSKFSLVDKCGAVCRLAKPFSKSTLPELVRSIK